MENRVDLSVGDDEKIGFHVPHPSFLRRISGVGSRAPSPVAARWLESGLLDVPFYAALRGQDFRSAVEAAEDFVGRGMSQRLSPHPFLDFVSLPPETRRAWRRGEVGRVLEHLAGEDGRMQQVGPLATSAEPASARASLLGLAARLGREATDDADPEPAPVDWGAVAAQTRRRDRVSVIVVAAQARQTVRTVQSVLRNADDRELEVLVVDCGSPPHVALGLHASFHDSVEVEVVRLPGTFSGTAGTNVGVARSSGEVVIILEPHVQVRAGWMTDVLDAMEDPAVAGVMPLVLQPDDTIDSAGMAVLADDRAPVPLLRGHQKEDARRLRGTRLSAVCEDVIVLRAQDVAAVGGLGTSTTRTEAVLDLCARLLRQHPAGFRVVPTALVTSLQPDGPSAHDLPSQPLLPADPGLYQRIGFVTERRESPDRPVAEWVVTGRHRERPDQLRWSIKLPSLAGHKGDNWGDTHFAEALGEALRGLGQDVVTCRRGAHAAGPTHLDDVALSIRGLHLVPPTPGQVNVLWVISHPDEVDPGEFDGYDLVFAASHAWSAELSARTGQEVIPLLQATEFGPPPGAPTQLPTEPSVVFVGSAHSGRERPLVQKALDAGVRLAVYGPGWEGLPAGVWRGAYIDNHRLPELYHRHGIVLADHWPDMARNGFIANRVFDAVASGARVICDDVVGLHDVFDPRDVVVVRTSEEIARAVAELSGSERDVDVPRPALSFDDRARSLLALVSAGLDQPSVFRRAR